MPLGTVTVAPTRPARLKPSEPDRSTPIPRPHAFADVDVTTVFGPTIAVSVSDALDVALALSCAMADADRFSATSSCCSVSGMLIFNAEPYLLRFTPAMAV